MKNLRRISLLFLIMLIAFSINVFADYRVGEPRSPEDPLYERKMEEEEENTDDYGIMLASYDTKEDISYIISKFVKDPTIAVGVDVSSWQENIDWKAVANAGVKFAIIRCCYRTTVSGELLIDKYYKQNIEGAINNGIYVGAYCYSAAINEDEAIEEANLLLDLIKGYDIKYCVAFDYEEFGYESHRTYNLSLDQVNKDALAFLSKIKDAGYIASLYGSASFFTEYWDMSKFTDYDVWAAHWGQDRPKCDRYNMFQYSATGRVPGISGDVDVDIDYTYYLKNDFVDITPYMFNSEFYADCNPDLKNTFGYNEKELKAHYDSFGKAEGRIATPVFDPVYYANANPDIKANFGNNYVDIYNHFVKYGVREKRKGSKYFDVYYYLLNNADVAKTYYNSGSMAVVHYMKNGINEGRISSSDFNIETYKSTVDEFYKHHIKDNNFKYIALDAGGEPVNMSNIDITPFMFDPMFYYNKYTDLQEQIGPNPIALKEHFETFGKKEGRQASRIFDPVYYANANPDIKQYYGDDYAGMYDHFIKSGAKEGRDSSGEFQVRKYLSNNEDLRLEFGTYYTKAIEHYVSFGINEGRVAY